MLPVMVWVKLKPPTAGNGPPPAALAVRDDEERNAWPTPSPAERVSIRPPRPNSIEVPPRHAENGGFQDINPAFSLPRANHSRENPQFAGRLDANPDALLLAPI